MSALSQIDDWPVPQAAVAVIGADGVRQVRGASAETARIASVSKLLTAYAIVIGVSEGAVDLDEPAGPPGATLRHLLAHTAGYGFDSDAGVLAPVGSRRIYSNRGIEEAAIHFARASSMPFADYLREAVLDPLGMNATDSRGSPAFGLLSSVDDLARFAAELLRPTLLPVETFTELTAVQFPGLSGVIPGVGRFDPCDWGLGFERNFGRPRHWAGQAVSREGFGHFGGAGSFVWVDPVARLACVCLTGRDFGPWALEVWPRLCTDVLAENGT